MMFKVLRNSGFVSNGNVVHDASAKYDYRGKGIVVEILNDNGIVCGKSYLPPTFYEVIEDDMTDPDDWVRGFMEMMVPMFDPEHEPGPEISRKPTPPEHEELNDE